MNFATFLMGVSCGILLTVIADLYKIHKRIKNETK